ncbi:hypothetical protein [Aurantiacibacter spongiae]|uniref:Uncharacterized protein n=1 Tax=Aurantiacibacter spongiae TaxID=2488860 RepID=A0A3N5CWJ4_9SPHN|nr:hypothetical protein [Aurantiacibacter spongiae]RPF71009.1 hypothetical protein EG799_04815 [Aurantiacibacter spongiae]
MKEFFRSVNPKRAVEDFAEQWRQPTPHRWQILGVAAAATFAIFTLFIPETQRMAPPRPEVIYITTFDENRTQGEIIAANCANQRLKDEIAARIAANDEKRREMYKTLGRATFIDVDEMEAEIKAREAAEEAANPDDGPSDEELALSVEEYCSRATG